MRPLYKCCLQETHFRPRDTYRLKVRGWKKIFHENGNQKLYRQAKAKRIQHHSISFTTNATGTSLGRKHKRRKKLTKNKPKTMKKMAIETYISIALLNVNGLNAPTKRHRLDK